MATINAQKVIDFDQCSQNRKDIGVRTGHMLIANGTLLFKCWYRVRQQTFGRWNIINGSTVSIPWLISFNFQEDHIDERIEKGDGPVMIIVCLDPEVVEKVERLCSRLLSNEYSCETYVHHGTGGIEVHWGKLFFFVSKIVAISFDFCFFSFVTRTKCWMAWTFWSQPFHVCCVSWTTNCNFSIKNELPPSSLITLTQSVIDSARRTLVQFIENFVWTLKRRLAHDDNFASLGGN